MREKVHSYLGFAKRSGNLITGYNTCIHGIQKKKVKLLILTEDVSENTSKKFMKLCNDTGVPCIVFGSGEELSRITGTENRGVFGITDHNFARVITNEIDHKKEVR